MMPNYDAVRSAAPVWYFRIVQLLLTLIVLGVAGDTALDWKNWHCNTPANVAFNIAAAALTIPPIFYLLASSGPKTSSHLLPWNQWVQLALDAVLFIFWLAVAAASTYTCSGLCAACAPTDLGYGYSVWAGNLVSACAESGGFYAHRNVKTLLERSTSNTQDVKAVMKLAKIAAKQGFDALMVVSLFITLGMTVNYIVKARKAAASAHSASAELTHDYQAGARLMGQEDKTYPATAHEAVPERFHA